MIVRFVTPDGKIAERRGQTFVPRKGDIIGLPELESHARKVLRVWHRYSSNELDAAPLKIYIELGNPLSWDFPPE